MSNNIILDNLYKDRVNELYVIIPVIDIEYLHSIEEELFQQEIVLPIYLLRYVKNIKLLDNYINKFNEEFHGETVDWWVKKTQKQVSALDKLIKECPPLLEDTVLYRGGRLDDGVNGEFKTFNSCSYNKNVAENFRRDGEYLIKIYAPKGTKGIADKGRDFGFENNMYVDTEHEFTIGRNQKYVVLEKNDEEMTATIVLV